TGWLTLHLHDALPIYMAEFIILEALLSVMLSIWVCCSALVAAFIIEVCAVILKAMYSTIITAPSIIIPKSIAPKLIKLASIPKRFIKEMANKRHKGITEATTSPDLRS